MLIQILIQAFTASFIVGMIWLRTRMQYAQPGTGALALQPAGKIYMGGAVGVLVVGWALAPWIGHAFWPQSGATPMLTRAVWFLGTYYLFIIVHRILKTRGAAVFLPITTDDTRAAEEFSNSRSQGVSGSGSQPPPSAL
jgi:hypothetical protein